MPEAGNLGLRSAELYAKKFRLRLRDSRCRLKLCQSEVRTGTELGNLRKCRVDRVAG